VGAVVGLEVKDVDGAAIGKCNLGMAAGDDCAAEEGALAGRVEDLVCGICGGAAADVDDAGCCAVKGEVCGGEIAVGLDAEDDALYDVAR
jgi:hypothetical protein